MPQDTEQSPVTPTYRMGHRDTVWGISQDLRKKPQYQGYKNITEFINAIKQYNPGLNIDRVRAGTQIKLPPHRGRRQPVASPSTVPNAEKKIEYMIPFVQRTIPTNIQTIGEDRGAGYYNYRIRKGDTVSKLLQRHGITGQAQERYKPKFPATLRQGTWYKFPRWHAAVPRKAPPMHIIQKRDTPSDIARAHNLPLQHWKNQPYWVKDTKWKPGYAVQLPADTAAYYSQNFGFNPYKVDTTDLLNAEFAPSLAFKQSRGNPQAHRQDTDARGPFQLRPGAWKQAQEYYKKYRKYNDFIDLMGEPVAMTKGQKDMREDLKQAYKVAMIYKAGQAIEAQLRRRRPVTSAEILRLYTGGVNGQGSKEAKKYSEDVLKWMRDPQYRQDALKAQTHLRSTVQQRLNNIRTAVQKHHDLRKEQLKKEREKARQQQNKKNADNGTQPAGLNKSSHLVYSDYACALSKLAAQSANAVQSIARTYYPQKGPNSWQHIRRVRDTASKIVRKLYDRQLTPQQDAAIMMHDSTKRQFGGEAHGRAGAVRAYDALRDVLSEDSRQEVAQAIAVHDDNLKQFPSTTAQLLAAADANPPDPDFLLNKAYVWRKRRSGLEGMDNARDIIKCMPQVYGVQGSFNAPGLYIRYYGKPRVDKFRRFIDTVGPQQVLRRVQRFRKRHGHTMQDTQHIQRVYPQSAE